MMETRIDKDGATIATSAGDDAHVQRDIITSIVRAQLIRQLTLLGVATIFILAGCFLIAFAPAGREQTITIVAGALFTIAVGLGGFTFFRLRAPLVSAEVGSAGGTDPDRSKNTMPVVER